MTEIVSRQSTGNEILPEGWEWTTLAEIGVVASGGTPKTKEPSNFDGNIPWITPADLSGYAEKTVARGKRNISEKGLDTSSARLLPEGTVIFSSRAPVGYVVIAENPVSTNQSCKNLIPSNGVFNEYVYYYLKGSKSLAESYASGTTFLELSAKAFGRLPIPLPPLNEQRRIVEKIEELFTKLDAGVRLLEQARAQLKSYRRSVLKVAVEGELSREWREAHGDELEPASELLERILQERREKFAGKKYKEPASPDTSELPAPPDGWEWATADQLFGFVTSGSRGWAKYYADEGATFLRIGNLDHDSIALDLRSVQKVQPPLGAEGTRTRVTFGDVLISITADIGKVAVVPPNFEEAYINQHIALARPSHRAVVDYVAWYLVSQPGNKQLTGRQYGATKPGLSLDDIRTVDIPFPPLEEQRFIVEEVERRLSVVDKLEETVEANLKQADILRQSILKRAFSGELVPQDPDDEPASVLLERIKEEHQAMKQKARKPRKAKNGDGLQGRLI